MSDIQRYDLGTEWTFGFEESSQTAVMDPAPDGDYVTYADHVAAVAEAEQRAYDNGVKDAKPWADDVQRQWDKGYEQGQRDAVSAPITDDNTYASVYGHGWTNGQADGYANALADAVAAVEALFPMPDVPQPIRGEQVIAAIKGVQP